MSEGWRRRKFLKTSGVTGLATLIGGCADDSSPSENQESEPRSSPEQASSSPSGDPESQTSAEQIDSIGEEFQYLVGLETESHLDSEGGRRIEREYTAYSQESQTTYKKTFSRNVYEFYANQSRQYVDNTQYKYGSYVSDRLDKYIIDSIVSEFERYGENNNHNERQIIEHMMSFVQNLEYTTDIRGTGWNDYPKYPIETLVEREGDCEDTAILMANLLRNYGYGTKLIYATEDMTGGDAGGHMAVGIKGEGDVRGTYYQDDNEDRYYFIETTASGVPIGKAPSWMNDAYLHPVGIHPVPGAVTAKVADVTNEGVIVEGESINTGAVGTDKLMIRLTLIDSDRRIIDQKTSEFKSVSGFNGDIDNLGPEHQATTRETLQPEQPEEMRLVAESLVNFEEVSQTESPLQDQ